MKNNFRRFFFVNFLNVNYQACFADDHLTTKQVVIVPTCTLNTGCVICSSISMWYARVQCTHSMMENARRERLFLEAHEIDNSNAKKRVNILNKQSSLFETLRVLWKSDEVSRWSINMNFINLYHYLPTGASSLSLIQVIDLNRISNWQKHITVSSPANPWTSMP